MWSSALHKMDTHITWTDPNPRSVQSRLSPKIIISELLVKSGNIATSKTNGSSSSFMGCLHHKIKLPMAISDLSACENIAGTWCSNWVSNCDNPGYRVRYGSGDWDTVAHYCQESCGLCGTDSGDSNAETGVGNDTPMHQKGIRL